MKKHITNKISQQFGKFASHKFTPFIQSFINNSYVKILNLDMREFDNPSNYDSLNALFTRKLKIKREFDTSPTTIISPADSFISDCGDIKKDKLFQIKSMEYSFKEMLIKFKEENLNRVIDGKFINFYLSPKDYHRYHCPIDMSVKRLVYVPAKLYPVNNRYLRKKLNLFIENERVMLECQDRRGKIFYMIFVGALNVGQMSINFEPKVETNANKMDIMVFDYNNIELKKGDEIGTFKMGSTVVIIFEKDFGEITINKNVKVNFGDRVMSSG